jgi:hypothetical protein
MLTSRWLEFSDLELLPRGQAAAIPPDVIVSPAQEQSVLPALKVGLEVSYVSAGGREGLAGRGASVPRGVAVPEACLAAVGAIAAGSLNFGKPRQG